jgi:hypothetical protein
MSNKATDWIQIGCSLVAAAAFFWFVGSSARWWRERRKRQWRRWADDEDVGAH